jgi:hypothetical protein
MAGIDHSAIYPMQGSIDFRVQQKTLIDLQEFGVVETNDSFEYMSNYKSEGGLLKAIKAELKKVETQAKKGNVEMEYKYFLRTYRGQQWNWDNDEGFTLWTLFKYNNEKNQSWNYFGCDALFQGMSKDPKSFKGKPFQSTKNEWINNTPPSHYRNYKEFLKALNIDIDDVKR